MKRTSLLAALVVLNTSLANATIDVPGFRVQTFANVTDPMRLTFTPDGTVFVGRDNIGSGGGFGDAVRIHRISMDGQSVTEYGALPIPDPDCVAFDQFGLISGIPSSVLVGGRDGVGGTQIVAIRPDESIHTVFSTTSGFADVGDMLFDNTGRLLFLDEAGTIFSSTGSFPDPLISGQGLTGFGGFALDGSDRIYAVGSDGMIKLFDRDGQLLDASYASLPGANALVYSPGGSFDAGLYAFSGGNLYRVDEGTTTVVGTGFPEIMLASFAPGGDLYISRRDNDDILCIQAVPEPSSLVIFAGFVLCVVCAIRWRACEPGSE